MYFYEIFNIKLYHRKNSVIIKILFYSNVKLSKIKIVIMMTELKKNMNI